jgi:hypothetical protein
MTMAPPLHRLFPPIAALPLNVTARIWYPHSLAAEQKSGKRSLMRDESPQPFSLIAPPLASALSIAWFEMNSDSVS